MEQVFCRILIDAPGCKIRIESETERKAAEAAEIFLRLCRGRTRTFKVAIECIDGPASDRLLKYLSDVADEWERI
jgi:hypothetical protein